jgi:hypothetical protein
MGDDTYSAGTPEVEIERLKGQPMLLNGETGKLGWVMLTNDRILFTQQKFASGQGGALTGLVTASLQKRSEKKAGGPREVVVLDRLRSGKPVKRRLLADLYVLEMDDGSTCRLAAKTGKSWSPKIRRLLEERHGRTVVEDPGDSWHVE